MTDQPQLPRPFRGEAQTDRPVVEHGPVAPFHATLKVVPLRLRRGVTFQVISEWTGPPAPYMQPDPRPGSRQDVYTTGDLQLAKAIAGAAIATLGRGEIPDLRELAERVRGRLAAGPYG